MATMATTITERPRVVGASASPARARWCTVHIDTEAGTYVGTMYVPETKRRLSDVLCDDRPFLSLVQVATNGSEHLEPYVAINKKCIRTVRIVHEGDPEVLPLRPR